jgi:predicted small lipoprotein YifL
MMNTTGILGRLSHWGRLAGTSALLATGVLVSACGQKGPLYLPTPGQQNTPAKPSDINTAPMDDKKLDLPAS